MSRKLAFTDEQIADAYAAGISTEKMAQFLGVRPMSIWSAINRARDSVSSRRSLPGGMTRVASQPIAHRATGDGSVAYNIDHIDLGVIPLDLYECADLLREWKGA